MNKKILEFNFTYAVQISLRSVHNKKMTPWKGVDPLKAAFRRPLKCQSILTMLERRALGFAHSKVK